MQREAYEVGSVAVQEAISGKTDYMVILKRKRVQYINVTTSLAKLEDVANKEKKVPKEFINSEGNFVSEAFLIMQNLLLENHFPNMRDWKKYLYLSSLIFIGAKMKIKIFNTKKELEKQLQTKLARFYKKQLKSKIKRVLLQLQVCPNLIFKCTD